MKITGVNLATPIYGDKPESKLDDGDDDLQQKYSPILVPWAIQTA